MENSQLFPILAALIKSQGGGGGGGVTPEQLANGLAKKKNTDKQSNIEWMQLYSEDVAGKYLIDMEDADQEEYEPYFMALDEILTDNSLEINKLVPLDETETAIFLSQNTSTGEYFFFVVNDGMLLRVYFEEEESTSYCHFERIYLEDFATKARLTELLLTKQDVLTAGTNITIVDNVISATGSGGDSRETIELTGVSGTLDSEEIALVNDDTKNVVLNADGKLFRLFNEQSTLTYKTFINFDAAVSSTVSAKAIYIQLNEEAVNYGHWSLENLTIGGTPTAEDLDELIDGTGDITVGLNDDNDTLLIGTHAKTIEITDVPSTATQGTLTEEQLADLLESEKSVIKFNNELYFLNDNGHEAGIRGYSHTGVENSKFMLKNITVTISTRAWVLTTEEVGGGGEGAHVLTTADYNWPTSNPDGVAVWKLDAGIYQIDESVYLYLTSSDIRKRYDATNFFISDATYQGIACKRYIFLNYALSGSRGNTIYVGTTTTSGGGQGGNATFSVLRTADTVNGLTSTSTTNPLSAAQGKVLKDLIDSLVISGTGAPTTSTVGTVGKLYEDTTNGDLYQCTAVSGSTYTWEAVGGGGGVNVVQSTGTSTTDVMSQNATTTMVHGYSSVPSAVGIFSSSLAYTPASGGVVIVSGNANVSGLYPVVIGTSKTNLVNYGVSIGYQSGNDINANYGVSIGAYSTATARGEFSIGGSSLGTNGYNNSQYRLLTNVYDGQSAHDACTKGQLDAALAQIAALEARIAALEA